ncbi:hypothetical protein Acr_22g0006650 [Actinidia rufa]|uniref:DUF4283 domain-containing protein n=1 Tax=Actinidia rufa TaxID=165716 RepID=A0A7J0GKC3_9ERIC|nr:hypothetical protein Acr_22g0006650 [Actinidia rufa]
MRRILSLGRKSVEISTDGVPEGTVVIVERDLGVQRRLTLTTVEVEWLGGVLSRIQASHHWGSYENLRGGSRNLEILRKYNSRGEALTGFGLGFGEKVRRKEGERYHYATQRSTNTKYRETLTYAQVAASGSWPEMNCEVHPNVGMSQDVAEVIPSSCTVIPFLRDRCSVGTLENWKGVVPRAKEVEGWCNSKWEIGSPVEVKDMNGTNYMFILPSKAEARRIRNTTWKFEGVSLGLRFWEDRCGCYTDENKPESLWIRVLGLPVFLWSEELFRALGDRCGGYITTAEETMHREHVQWVRICVRGKGGSILATLMVGMGSLAYVCPIWVEAGARVARRSEPTRYSDRTRWRKVMGKEITGERNGNRGGGTRGSNAKVHFEKKHFCPKKANHKTAMNAERRRNITTKASELRLVTVQEERLTRARNRKGELRFQRDLRTVLKDEGSCRGWARFRDSGREGFNCVVGPNYNKGVGGKKPSGHKQEERGGTRASHQDQKYGPNKNTTEAEAEAIEEYPPGLNSLEDSNSMKHVLADREGGDSSRAANSIRSGSEGGATWTSSREEQTEEDEEMIEAFDQRQERKLKGFGKFLGISYGGMEDEAIRLFARIEQQWRERACTRGGRNREVCTSKGLRELKNLEWSVFEGRRKGRGRSWPRGVKENLEDGNTWAFAGVYGPHNKGDKRGLWEELAGARATGGTPWVCGGDFNVVRFPFVAGGQASLSAMRDFSEYIKDEELIDLPLGDSFTWSNGTAFSRLDRFLISSDWEGEHMDVRQYCLPIVVSDHKPVFLVGGGKSKGPAPFKFENMWLQAEGFEDLVRKWWQGYSVHGSPSYHLARKLKLLKEDLKRWNREVLANLTEELQVLETKEQFPGLTKGERNRRVEMKAEIGRLFNFIGKIRVDKAILEGQDSVADSIVSFYDMLFKESEQWRPKVDGMRLPSLNSEEVDSLAKSGLKINLVKSELIQVGDGTDQRRLAETMECKVWGDFHPHVKYQLGNGSRIRFWHDEGCSQIRDRFPELFALATHQDASVVDCWSSSAAGGFGILCLGGGAQDWELEVFVDFFRLIQEGHPISQADYDYEIRENDGFSCLPTFDSGGSRTSPSPSSLILAEAKLSPSHSTFWLLLSIFDIDLSLIAVRRQPPIIPSRDWETPISLGKGYGLVECHQSVMRKLQVTYSTINQLEHYGVWFFPL